jgi:hypothetical protein
MTGPDYPEQPVPTGPGNPSQPSGPKFWSVLVGLALTGGFTFGAVLAWLS